MHTFNASPRTVVIVGASHSGVATATELRNAGYAGEIILVGDETGLPYHRPHLSKDSLTAQMPEPKDLKPASFYKERGITLRLGTEVTAIDRSAKQLQLRDGGSLPYDALVLATGANARSLPAALQGGVNAVVLRDRLDWQALTAAFAEARSLAVIGGGFIGLEVAAAAREKGLAVTVVEAAERLMMRSVYPVIAERVLAEHRDSGINIRLGVTVSKVTAQGLSLADGSEIDADLVLACVGSQPRTVLAVAAQLPCSNGVDTDAFGRTADPAIFATGDCAHWDHQGAAARHESIAATQYQAKVIAATLTGKPTPPPAPFRLWSFQGAVRLQMCGPVVADAEIHVDAPDENSLILRASLDGRLIAVQALNASRQFGAAVAELDVATREALPA